MSDDMVTVIVGYRCTMCGAEGTERKVLDHAAEEHGGDGVDDYIERIVEERPHDEVYGDE